MSAIQTEIQAILDARKAIDDAEYLFVLLDKADKIGRNLTVGGSGSARELSQASGELLANLQASARAVQDLNSSLSSGTGAARAMRDTGAAARQAANDAVALAQAEARLQTGAGNLTGAIQTLQQALLYEDASAQRLIATETQLNALKLKLAASYNQQAAAIRSGLQPQQAATAGASAQQGILSSLATRIIATAAAYLTFREAIRVTTEAIDARELMDRLDIGMKAIAPSARVAAEEEAFLIAESNRLGLSIEDTIPSFIKISAAMQASGLTFRQTEQLFTDISIASKALGLSSSTTSRILYDMQEMLSQGSVNMRVLRQMIMQMPGALDAFANAAGVTKAKFLEMVHQGMVDPMFLATKGADALAAKYSGSLTEAVDTLESHINRLKNSWTQMLAELGKAPVIKGTVDTLAHVMDMGSKAWRDQQRAHAKDLTALYQTLAPGDQRGFYYDEGSGNIKGSGDVSVEDMEKTLALQQKYSAARTRKIVGAYNPAHGGMDNSPTASEGQLKEMAKDAAAFWKVYRSAMATTLDDEARRRQEIVDKFEDQISKVSVNEKYSQAEKDALIKTLGEGRDSTLKSYDVTKQVRDYSAEVKGIEDTAKRVRDLRIEFIQDNDVRKAAQINAQYDDLRKTLDGIQAKGGTGVTDEDYDALDASRSKALRDLRTAKNPARFAGQDLVSLESQQHDLQRQLPAITDPEEFQRTAQRIQEISQAMAARLKGDAAGISESFRYGFKATADNFGTASEQMSQAGADVASSLTQNIAGGLTAIEQHTMSTADAFKQMALNIIQSLQDIANKLIAMAIVKGFSSIISGSLGGADSGPTSGGWSGGTTSDSVSAGVNHAGGFVGDGSPNRYVAGTFARAPRMHSGSMGPIGDEVPIVARRGEHVITPEQAKAQRQPTTIIMNVAHYIDPDDLAAARARNPQMIVFEATKYKKELRQVIMSRGS